MFDQARELNNALPETLRITIDAGIAATVDELVMKGWTVAQVADTIRRRTNQKSGTGAVIYLLRNLSAEAPPAVRSTGPLHGTAHTYFPDDYGLTCRTCNLPASNRHHTAA